MKKTFIALIVAIVVSNAFSQGFYEIPDLKVAIAIERNSSYAYALYASRRVEILDVTAKLLNEINAYMELELWISAKSYYMGMSIDIYGDEKFVNNWLENFGGSKY